MGIRRFHDNDKSGMEIMISWHGGFHKNPWLSVGIPEFQWHLEFPSVFMIPTRFPLDEDDDGDHDDGSHRDHHHRIGDRSRK